MQQFKAFCFTVFTGGILRAFIGNHWNLGHLHHGIGRATETVRWMRWIVWQLESKVKIDLRSPLSIWHGWKTGRIKLIPWANTIYEIYKCIFTSGLFLLQAIVYQKSKDFQCCIEWDYVCWFVIGMYMIQYEGKPLGTKRSRKGNQF